MKKMNFIIFLAVLFMVIGISLLLYPHISNYLYEKNVKEEQQIFIANITSEEHKENFERLYEKLREENEHIFENKQKDLIDPFSYEQPSINLDEYGIYNNTIGYLKIPKMNVELPILLGANKKNMEKGAVHLTHTSYPIGGTNTNCVLAAHRGYARAAFFRDIEALEIGDKIYIQNFREELTYEVEEVKIIDPTDVKDLLIKPNEDIVTLITCHPYRHNYKRYVVFCKRVTLNLHNT